MASWSKAATAPPKRRDGEHHMSSATRRQVSSVRSAPVSRVSPSANRSCDDGLRVARRGRQRPCPPRGPSPTGSRSSTRLASRSSSAPRTTASSSSGGSSPARPCSCRRVRAASVSPRSSWRRPRADDRDRDRVERRSPRAVARVRDGRRHQLREPTLRPRPRDHRRQGVDLVVDPVGGQTLEGSIAALAYRGRVSWVGRAGREDLPADIWPIMQKNGSITGVFLGAEMAITRRGSRPLIASLLARVPRPVSRGVIDRTFPLAEAADAPATSRTGMRLGGSSWLPEDGNPPLALAPMSHRSRAGRPGRSSSPSSSSPGLAPERTTGTTRRPPPSPRPPRPARRRPRRHHRPPRPGRRSPSGLRTWPSPGPLDELARGPVCRARPRHPGSQLGRRRARRRGQHPRGRGASWRRHRRRHRRPRRRWQPRLSLARCRRRALSPPRTLLRRACDPGPGLRRHLLPSRRRPRARLSRRDHRHRRRCRRPQPRPRTKRRSSCGSPLPDGDTVGFVADHLDA